MPNEIHSALDCEFGSSACARQVEAVYIRLLLLDIAADCARRALELAQLIGRYGGGADEYGSAAGAMHGGLAHIEGTRSHSCAG